MARPANAEVVFDPADTAYGGVEQMMPSPADMAAASTQPIADKFLKYNKGDATPPAQILARYSPNTPSEPADSSEILAAQHLKGRMPDDAEVVHAAAPVAQPPSDAMIVTPHPDMPPDAEIVKGPDTMSLLADALAGGMHSAVQNAALVGDTLIHGGLGTLGLDKIGDQIPPLTDMVPPPDKPLVPPEQAAMASPLQKVGVGVVGSLPVLGEAMATGNPLAAAAIMGGNAGLSTGKSILDQGGSLGAAQEAAGMSTLVNAAGTAPILKAGSLISQVLWGGATNPVIGAMDDIATKNILTNYGNQQDPANIKIAASINPYDLQKRLTEMGVGVAMGVGFHVADLPARYRENKLFNEVQQALRDKEKFSTWAQDQITKLDQTISPLVGDRTVTTPESLGVADHDAALKQLLDPTNEKPTNVSDVLDILASHPDISEPHRAYAQVLQRLSGDLGLDLSQIKGTSDDTASAGHYDPITDTSTIHTKKSTDAGTILHEITHAAFNKAIDLFQNHTGGQLTDRQQQIADRVDPINTVFARARDLAFQNPELKSKFDLAEIDRAKVKDGTMLRDDPLRNNHDETTYGFRSLKEFVSETMTQPKFQKQLSEMRAVDSQGAPLPIVKASGSKVKNMWQAAKQALKNILNPQGGVSPAPKTLFDVAYDHISNLGSELTASERTANERSVGRSGDRAWLREDAKAQLNDSNRAFMFGRISQLLREASSKSEFLHRLDIEMSNPRWKEFVASRGESLWNNADHVIKTLDHSDANYKNLSDQTKLLTVDPRSVDEFFKDEFGDAPQPLTKGDDITPFGTAFLPAINVKFDKASSVMQGKIIDNSVRGTAGKLVAYVLDKARMYTSLGAKLHAEAAKYYVEYHKLDRKGQENMMNEALYWDDATAGRKQLKTLGLQWPTKEILMGRGLTEAEAHAYGEVTKGLDYLHSLLQEARMKSGQPPIDRIPGYMPHVFKGAYKVLVKGIEEATGRELIVQVKGYQTKYGALNYLRALKKGSLDSPGWRFEAEPDPQYPGRLYRVQKIQEVSNSIMTTLQEHMNAYANNSLLNPGIAEHLEQIDNASKRGFSKHLIERSDVAGYLGKADMNSPAGLNQGIMAKIGLSRTNNQIRELYDNYAKNVTEYYKNVMFMSEVTQPILNKVPEPYENGSTYGALLDHVTELQDYIQKFTYNFTGEGLNHLNRFIDKPARAISEAIGLSPTLYREAAGMLRNTFALFKLRANPGFYVGNALQWGHVMTMLEMVNAMRAHDGQKSPYVMVSMMKALKEVSPGPELAAALEWARDNHVIDPQLEAEMRRMQPANQAMDLLAKTTGGPINPAIERFSREVAFRIAYMHMREIYPGDVMKARQAAGQLMRMTMVDYDRSSRPLMFQQLGVVGEAISPFQVYRNAYLGNLEIMFRLAAQTRLTKPQMMLPLLTSVGTFIMLAGVNGMPLAAEYNAIMNTIQKLFPEDAAMFPTLPELLLKAKVPAAVSIGMLSDATKHIPGLENGVFIGSSVNSVDTTQPLGTAMFPFLDAIKDLAGVGIRFSLHEMFPHQVYPVNMSDIYAASKAVAPGILGHYIEKLVRPPMSNVAPKGTTLEGSVRLSPADIMAQNIGKQSNVVSEENIINRLVNSMSQSQKLALKRLVSSAADIQMGYGLQGTADEMEKEATSYPLSMPRTAFYKMVADEVFSRSFPAREVDARTQTPEANRRNILRHQLESK